jgi:hypothetical protein
MANRYKGSGANVDQNANILMAPGIALTTWNPFLAGALNSQGLEELGTIADEWQGFVGRRLKEDVALLQRLTRSTTPDQVLSAYADFWQKAGEDYGSEITKMTKLMTDMTSRMTTAAQSATEEASTQLQRKAA